MGKHNGKARKTGMSVGKALANKVKMGNVHVDGKNVKHTTDLHQEQQSILEQSDLDSIMATARMAGRDFTAERRKIVVLDAQTVSSKKPAASPEQRQEAEARVIGKLKIPRRPHWNNQMSPDTLDAQEREMFLDWRRHLAKLEENEPDVVLTPFEKNLEVWRQLWRVMERSDIIVQIVDARDPLLYRSKDLEAYAKEINPTKSSMLLLNKADLLSPDIRSVWADYFDANNIQYAFWSAKNAEIEDGDENEESNDVEEETDTDEPSDTLEGNEESREGDLEVTANAQSEESEAVEKAEASGLDADPRIAVLSASEVLAAVEYKAKQAIESSSEDGTRRSLAEQRLTVGLVGYPNVGKSSTINVLYGQKKTAVAATPGKTKHFQTLNVSDTLCLCDCPGLVFPQIAQSKAEMVSAGVIPIDRLVDVHAPVQVVADKMGYRGIEKSYGVTLPRTEGRHSPLAAEFLAAVATGRGWVRHGGLPDETRTGRMILKDYVNGKLLSVSLPPGVAREEIESSEDEAGNVQASTSNDPQAKEFKDDMALTPGDVDILEDATGGPGGPAVSSKKTRAAHKYQKKPRRTKGDRGQRWNDDTPKTVHAFVKGRGNLTNGILGGLNKV